MSTTYHFGWAFNYARQARQAKTLAERSTNIRLMKYARKQAKLSRFGK